MCSKHVYRQKNNLPMLDVPPAIEVTEKQCTLCDETKPLSEFGKNSHNKSGLQHRCKPCRKLTRRCRVAGCMGFVAQRKDKCAQHAAEHQEAMRQKDIIWRDKKSRWPVSEAIESMDAASKMLLLPMHKIAEGL